MVDLATVTLSINSLLLVSFILVEGEAKKYIVNTTLPCARLCETQRRELGHVGHTACATDRLYGPHKLVGPFSVKLVRVVFQSAFQCQQYYRLC
ncbi:hypothetical protein ES332_A04G163800v1 [Gossypium tomentosum]|uniref:Secreted protein n=1 Tax=Gossypium tomentosum TaxID=34277 RepID=A0A5D2R2Z8_GOSTO|nr:hypothetical protein ES332_A04G163800v1 [Gossypium tomentosum]